MSINELCDKYIDYSVTRYAVATNRARFPIIRKYIVPELGPRDIHTVSPEDINSLFSKINNYGLSENSVFGIYVCLLSIFKYAKIEGYLSHSPMDESVKGKNGKHDN